MRRIGMLTSGGDCQALNATMRGVAKSLYNMFDDVEIIGFEDGYKGLMYADYQIMKSSDFSGILTQGGTILGTSRQPFKLMRTPDENGLDKVEAMKHTYKKLKLSCLVVLGGNGSQKTANMLSEEGLNVVSLPKTIDNDLNGTDHCPGFGSAARYIATTCMEVQRDTHVYDNGTITVLEIMGRHAGWLAGSAALAAWVGYGPDLIYLPEVDFDMERFLADVHQVYQAKNKCLIAVSEGIHRADGAFIAEGVSAAANDGFGHTQLGGLAALLADLLRQREPSAKVRGIELSLPQRCGAHSASQTDIDEAFLAGKAAVEAAVAGYSDKMVAFRCTREGGYRCETVLEPLDIVANAEKTVPRAWINADGNGLEQPFIDYVLPLIQGVPRAPQEHSLPRYARLKKVLVSQEA